MKAVGYFENLPAQNPQALIDIDIDKPVPGPRDLLVRVQAISVNPVDVKLRASSPAPQGKPRILGHDAVGTVEAVGPEVSLFKVGDEVFYAGAIDRPGTYSEYHVVDERIVGPKPKSLSPAEAAALPLTTLTAWELLFDRLRVPYGKMDFNEALLVINGSGGVGSILTQLARRLTGLTVIATGSRPETINWVRDLGAHHVIDHHHPLRQGIERVGLSGVKYVASLTATGKNQEALLDILQPHGSLAMIDDPEAFDIVPFKRKSLSVHWEFMFTPSMYKTPDMIKQHHILSEVSSLVDRGVIKTTLQRNLGPITAENLRQAHLEIEAAKGYGKIVLSGF